MSPEKDSIQNALIFEIWQVTVKGCGPHFHATCHTCQHLKIRNLYKLCYLKKRRGTILTLPIQYYRQICTGRGTPALKW